VVVLLIAAAPTWLIYLAGFIWPVGRLLRFLALGALTELIAVACVFYLLSKTHPHSPLANSFIGLAVTLVLSPIGVPVFAALFVVPRMALSFSLGALVEILWLVVTFITSLAFLKDDLS